MNAVITSFGSYLPERVLTNEDLEKMVETSDEWIFTRTGIRERRLASSEESTASMGAEAAKDALKKNDLLATDIDAIIVCSMTHDYFCPSTASIIQKELGATKAACIDIQAACAGYLYGLSIAKAWVESKAFNKVLLIATEKNSSFIDFEDRTTCVLFGDGAGASIIQNTGPGYSIRSISLGADGNGNNAIIIPAGGSKQPASHETVDKHLHSIKMSGKETFYHAVKRMAEASLECMKKEGISKRDIAFLVSHQANIRIIEATAKRLNLEKEKVISTIHKYGNTSSSTIPIALDELEHEKRVGHNDLLLLTAFGGGFSWGATILEKVE